MLHRLIRDDSGQDLIEYALLAGFISLVAVTAITSIGSGVLQTYEAIDDQFPILPGGGGGGA